MWGFRILTYLLIGCFLGTPAVFLYPHPCNHGMIMGRGNNE